MRDGPVQVAHQGQAAGIFLFLATGVHGVAAARRFGLVHGRMGAPHQGIGVVRVAGKQRDPDADPRIEHQLRYLHRLVQGAQQAPRRLDRFFGAGVRQQQRKLGLADPRQRFTGRGGARQAPAQFLQQRIARLVAQHFVDFAKPAHFQVQQRQRVMLLPGRLDRRFHRFQQQRSIGQSGQGIVERQAGNGRLRGLVLRARAQVGDTIRKIVRQLAEQLDFRLVEVIGIGRGHCQRAEHLAFHAQRKGGRSTRNLSASALARSVA